MAHLEAGVKQLVVLARHIAIDPASVGSIVRRATDQNNAPLAELVDARDSKSRSFAGVPVRFRRGAPRNFLTTKHSISFSIKFNWLSWFG